MPSKRLTPLLGLAFLLVCCVGWGNAQGEQAKPETVQEQVDEVQDTEPLTVCEVLQNLPLYSGKLIQIRGEWRGSALWDQCPKQIQTEDHEWPNAIYLICKESLLKREEPVDWSFGIYDYDQLWIQTLHYKLPVYATFEGRLDARAELLPKPDSGVADREETHFSEPSSCMPRKAGSRHEQHPPRQLGFTKPLRRRMLLCATVKPSQIS
jgi:hypothetical protein